jgi:hypothetical protein
VANNWRAGGVTAGSGAMAAVGQSYQVDRNFQFIGWFVEVI